MTKNYTRTAEQVANDVAALDALLSRLGFLDQDDNMGPVEAKRFGEHMKGKRSA